MLKEKIDQMSCSENFKNIMKKVLFALAVIGLAVIVLLNLAACNGDNSDKSPNTPNDNGDTSIEQVQETVGDILKTFDVTEPSIMDVAKDYVKSGEKLLSAKLNASCDLEMIFESGDNICCKTADLPAGAQTLLNESWQEYVLDKLGEKSLDKAIVGQDKIDSFKQRVSEAISDYKSAIKTLSGAETTLNTFGGGNFDDKGALKNIVSDELVVYKYNSVRADESFVISGVDKQGKVIEYLVQMNELGGGDVCKRFATGIEGVDYTLRRTVLDVSHPYEQPAEREIVSFDELYTSVFGKDFVFKPYKELMKELFANDVPNATTSPIVFGLIDGELVIYATSLNKFNEKNLVLYTFKGDEKTVNKILDYSVLCESLPENLKSYFMAQNKSYFNESEECETMKDELNSVKTKIETGSLTISSLSAKDFSRAAQLLGTSDNVDYEAFGEQYLKVAGKTDAKLIAAYVGAMSTNYMDDDNIFDTGYVCFFDISLMCEENGVTNLYKGQVAVPWYTNSSKESLYNSFLEGKKYKLRNENMTTITNANVLITLPTETENDNDLQNYKQDIYIDEDKRLA